MMVAYVPVKMTDLTHDRCEDGQEGASQSKVVLLLTPHREQSKRASGWLEGAGWTVMQCYSLELALDWLVEHEELFESVAVSLEDADAHWLECLANGLDVIGAPCSIILIVPFPALHEMRQSTRLKSSLSRWHLVPPVERFVLEALAKGRDHTAINRPFCAQEVVARPGETSVRLAENRSGFIERGLRRNRMGTFMAAQYVLFAFCVASGGIAGAACLLLVVGDGHTSLWFYPLGAALGGILPFALVFIGRSVIARARELGR